MPKASARGSSEASDRRRICVAASGVATSAGDDVAPRAQGIGPRMPLAMLIHGNYLHSWAVENVGECVVRVVRFGPRSRLWVLAFSRPLWCGLGEEWAAVAKRPGWYRDPWGGQGKRYWDGRAWTQNYVDDASGRTWLPADAGVAMRQPLATAARVRPWWQAWWFIGLLLFVVCWPAGLILIWTRDSTPRAIKLAATLIAVFTNLVLGLVFIKLGLYPAAGIR